MRTVDVIKHNIQKMQSSPGDDGLSFVEISAELLLDIREILLDMAERQGCDISSFFLEGQESV